MSAQSVMNFSQEHPLHEHTAILGSAIATFFESREEPDNAKSFSLLCQRLVHSVEKGVTHLQIDEYADICSDPSFYNAVGGPSEDLPIVLTACGNLYFRRHYEYEQKIAKSLAVRASTNSNKFFSQNEFYNDQIRSKLDASQSLAIAVGMTKKLFLLTGGPGTGKTFTIAHLLACMFHQSDDLSLALAAPTGKSAHRMRQSIACALESISLPPGTKEKLQNCSRARTLHRLLGPIHGSVDFKRNEESPLPYDVVVVDEASMIDLPLMAKLCGALREETTLILAGDADQLSPVHGGAVFNTLVRKGSPNCFSNGQKTLLSNFSNYAQFTECNYPLHGCLVSLNLAHRRAQGSDSDEIGNLCDTIREGRGKDALEIIKSSGSSVSLYESLDDPVIKKTMKDGYANLSSSCTVEDAIHAMSQFRVLCAHNLGKYGVDEWNERVKKLFPGDASHPVPVVISHNDYSAGLFNGDDGVLIGREAHFLVEESIRKISRARLPRHVTGYATTIHRSQGSEFDKVMIVLPPVDAKSLTRELLYVAVSRARSEVILVGDPQALYKAIDQPEQSRSGVVDLLNQT